MDRLAYPDAAPADQVGIGLEIVDDLGGQAADIDGVGRGEAQTGEILLVTGGEDLLYAGLGSSKLPRTAQTFTLAPSWVTI